MVNASVCIAIIFIVANLIYFFRNKTYKKSSFSTALFMKLFFVLLGITFGFGLLYYALSFQETVVVQSLSDNAPIEHSFGNLLYFSGVTMLSVGCFQSMQPGFSHLFKPQSVFYYLRLTL